MCWKDNPVADLQRQLPGHRRLPHAAVGDDRERGDEAIVIEPHVQLHRTLAQGILRPGKD